MKQRTRLERLYWFFGFAYDFSRWATLLLVVVVILNYFFYSVMVVRGASMLPTFTDGDVQLISRLAYEVGPPQRGDVVALNFPDEPNRRFIKRVIGLPGEHLSIRGGQVYINNQRLNESYLVTSTGTQPDLSLTIPAKEYFVMGDNRSNSSDSRARGPVPRSFIIGKVDARILTVAAKPTP